MRQGGRIYNMETNNSIEMLYYDPFAEEGQEYFNPIESFNQIIENYQQDKVEHNNAADLFVARTEALMHDAHFLERFDAVQAIAAQMHNMCGEDHNLRLSLESSQLFSGTHNDNDGHGHTINEQKEKIKKDDDEDDEEDDEYGWLGIKKVIKKRKK